MTPLRGVITARGTRWHSMRAVVRDLCTKHDELLLMTHTEGRACLRVGELLLVELLESDTEVARSQHFRSWPCLMAKIIRGS